MAQVAWRRGMAGTATFSLYFRGYPSDRSFYAVAGIESALEHLESFQFTRGDLAYLRSTQLFDDAFVSKLGDTRFTGDVRAVQEGTIAFADEPVLEISAPLIEAQIVETALLNAITFQTVSLTKATLIKLAAGDREVIDFGARRAHGQDAADLAARSSAIAGFTGTSNLRAAARFGIRPVGTMAHSFVQSFDAELSAFRAYASEFPATTTLLVDTYDTQRGVRNAITVAKEMEQRGERLRAVRLDSGDLLTLAIETRNSLDAADLDYVQITASGGLDQRAISTLVSNNAPIDSFGVGTHFAVSADAPYADSVYKLVSYDGDYTGKLSPGKETLPGPKQVYRTTLDGKYSGDIIAKADEPQPANSEPLLSMAMNNGARIGPHDTIGAARRRLRAQIRMLPVEPGSTAYPLAVSDELEALKQRFISDNAAGS